MFAIQSKPYGYLAEYLINVLMDREEMDWSYVESELPLNNEETRQLLQRLKEMTGINLYFTKIHLKYVSTLEKLNKDVDKKLIEEDDFLETRIQAIQDLFKAMKLDLRMF